MSIKLYNHKKCSCVFRINHRKGTFYVGASLLLTAIPTYIDDINYNNDSTTICVIFVLCLILHSHLYARIFILDYVINVYYYFVDAKNFCLSQYLQ